MTKSSERLWLQLFADGGTGGDGGAAPTGDTPAAAGQETQADRLRKLGVPESKLQRKRYSAVSAQSQQSDAKPETTAKDTTTETTTKNAQANPPQRQTLTELLKADPQLNAEMQSIIRRRLGEDKAEKDKYSALTEKLHAKYGTSSIDELINAVSNDDSVYEDKALEMGVTVDVAKKLDQLDSLQKQQREQSAAAERRKQLEAHFNALSTASEAAKAKFNGFDLQNELRNPKFVYMTAPNSPVDVETAYKAMHFDELVEAKVREAVNALASTTQANALRPRETQAAGGNSAQIGEFDWHNATKEQRDAMREKIRRNGKVALGGY